tara:strand:+ start:14998 stop:15150 length:153 start_codon:yes stop_codon:yes gene_type:complete
MEPINLFSLEWVFHIIWTFPLGGAIIPLGLFFWLLSSIGKGLNENIKGDQ